MNKKEYATVFFFVLSVLSFYSSCSNSRMAHIVDRIDDAEKAIINALEEVGDGDV